LGERSAALDALVAGLAGKPIARKDEVAAVSLANQSLITPIWARALARSGALETFDPDLRDLIADITARNTERNRRLYGQLDEVLTVLAKVGIEPVLLKGAALMATCSPDADDRIVADHDLLIRPAEVETTLAALVDAGFPIMDRYPGESVHVVAELARPTDVGPIDLHQRPPGPPGMAELADLRERCQVLVFPGGGRALVPGPELQIYFLMLHDQFHDGDFWRGGFDLRHLIDIALLSRRGVDWAFLKSLCRTRLVWNALTAQLEAARRLAGADVPRQMLGFSGRLHYQRHLAQYRCPILALPLAAIGTAVEGINLIEHRRADRLTRTAISVIAPQHEKSSTKISRIKDIMTPGSGKI